MIIIKNILLIFLFVMISGIGIIISDKYKKRVIDLKEMQMALNMFETKMKFTYEPIPSIFMQIAQNTKPNISRIFEQSAKKMKNLSAGDAWTQSINESKNYLKEEDKQILTSMNRLLGKTSIEGQISEIKLTSNFLNHQIKKAEEEEQKNKKMYKTLGVTLGLAIVIILI